jgi:hypothetical protein
MLKNNIAKGGQVIYFDIQFVEKKWYAFYNEDAEESLLRNSL